MSAERAAVILYRLAMFLILTGGLLTVALVVGGGR